MRGYMYKINMSIPGWNGKKILEIIAAFSSRVPENGNILELGALFGRTTYAIGHNKPASVTLHSLDIWPTILFSNHTEYWFHDEKCGEEETNAIVSRRSEEHTSELQSH